LSKIFSKLVLIGLDFQILALRMIRDLDVLIQLYPENSEKYLEIKSELENTFSIPNSETWSGEP